MTSRTFDIRRLWFIVRGVYQPVLFSWLVLLVFALCFYAMTADAPVLGDITYGNAAHVSTCLWATAFGGRCSISAEAAGGAAASATLSLMPLTITFIVLYSLTYICKRRLIHSWAEVAYVAIVQAALIAAIGLSMRLSGLWWIAVIGAAAFGALAAVWAGREWLFEDIHFWHWIEPLMPRVRKVLVLLVVLALAVFIVGAIIGARQIIEIHQSYYAGVVGGIGLVLVQFLYLPTVIMWVLSWMLGAGFAIGDGTYFSISGAQLQPIPAIPIFGALPHNGPWAALVLIPVVLALIWRARRDCPQVDGAMERSVALKKVAAESTTVVAAVALCLGLLGWVTRGSLGPGRMAMMGTRAELMIAAVIAVVGVPYIITQILLTVYRHKHAVTCTLEAHGVDSDEHLVTSNSEAHDPDVDVAGDTSASQGTQPTSELDDIEQGVTDRHVSVDTAASEQDMASLVEHTGVQQGDDSASSELGSMPDMSVGSADRT